MFRWRHAAVVVAVYLLMEQCGGRRGDYESYGRLAGMSEKNCPRLKDCPQNFIVFLASRPGVHFWDNLAALGIILQYSNKPDRGLFVLKPSE